MFELALVLVFVVSIWYMIYLAVDVFKRRKR